MTNVIDLQKEREKRAAKKYQSDLESQVQHIQSCIARIKRCIAHLQPTR